MQIRLVLPLLNALWKRAWQRFSFSKKEQVYSFVFFSAVFISAVFTPGSRMVLQSIIALPITPPVILSPSIRVAQLQLDDAAMDSQQSTPPALGDMIAGYPVSDIRKIRKVHPVTGQVNVWHKGFDIATPTGTPVYAPFVGTVSECVEDGRWKTYGIFRSPLFPNRYWLLHHLSWCQIGEYEKGDVWAKTGNAGTGPHLHVEGWVRREGAWDHYNLAKGWIRGFIDASVNCLG